MKQIILPSIAAKIKLKEQVLEAMKSKWPEEIAVYVDGLVKGAANMLYVAANAHDYFIPPDYKPQINWWIEAFSPRNEGRMAILVTTDKGLCDLLHKHGCVNRTAHTDGLMVVSFTEIIASGGKDKEGKVRKYTSLGVSSAMFHYGYPLTRRLTRLVSYDTINPDHLPGLQQYGKIIFNLFNTVYYHISHCWPVWSGVDPDDPNNPNGQAVAVFGFNPVLGAVADPKALLGALRSYREREG